MLSDSEVAGEPRLAAEPGPAAVPRLAAEPGPAAVPRGRRS
jgi:hypothetical protein